jgi:hypothetical protein
VVIRLWIFEQIGVEWPKGSNTSVEAVVVARWWPEALRYAVVPCVASFFADPTNGQVWESEY